MRDPGSSADLVVEVLPVGTMGSEVGGSRTDGHRSHGTCEWYSFLFIAWVLPNDTMSSAVVVGGVGPGRSADHMASYDCWLKLVPRTKLLCG